MQSTAKTPADYLAEIPAERLELVTRLRDTVLANLPAGYEEAINWGMLVYQVPFSIVPDTYNNQPLAYVALANQKQYVSLYLSGVYADAALRAWLEQGFADRGFKLRAGKSCIRFKNVKEVPWDLVGEAVATMQVDEFVQIYLESRKRS